MVAFANDVALVGVAKDINELEHDRDLYQARISEIRYAPDVTAERWLRGRSNSRSRHSSLGRAMRRFGSARGPGDSESRRRTIRTRSFLNRRRPDIQKELGIAHIIHVPK